MGHDWRMQLEPIGTVRSPREDPENTIGWGDVIARIELVDSLGTQSLVGLADFSHVDILFWFDRAAPRDSYTGLRPARGRSDMPPIGVFGARGPYRPNPIGSAPASSSRSATPGCPCAGSTPSTAPRCWTSSPSSRNCFRTTYANPNGASGS